jgi:hypothetical protein
MKKTHANKRLVLSRETVVNLDRLDGALLDRVAGGATNLCSGGSSCTNNRCTCPV